MSAPVALLAGAALALTGVRVSDVGGWSLIAALCAVVLLLNPRSAGAAFLGFLICLDRLITDENTNECSTASSIARTSAVAAIHRWCAAVLGEPRHQARSALKFNLAARTCLGTSLPFAWAVPECVLPRFRNNGHNTWPQPRREHRVSQRLHRSDHPSLLNPSEF